MYKPRRNYITKTKRLNNETTCALKRSLGVWWTNKVATMRKALGFRERSHMHNKAYMLGKKRNETNKQFWEELITSMNGGKKDEAKRAIRDVLPNQAKKRKVGKC